MALTIGQRLLIWTFKVVNFFVPWHWLPKYLGAFNLLALRDELRHSNLVDTYPQDGDHQGTASETDAADPKYLAVRNSDGLYNDLQCPRMGCAGMRFGRNVPRKYTKAPTPEELMTPNPRVVSERLMKRDAFKPAESLNLLAAAWIQFQVHDWAQHFFNRNNESNHNIPLPEGDSWSDPTMEVFSTQKDTVLSREDEAAPAYKNENTHWWDGSMIYGSTEAETQKLRDQCKRTGDGKLQMDKDGKFLPEEDGLPLTGFRENWWIGLEILHTLFAQEHNAICSHLKVTNPYWTSDQLFDTARLINCALMAKIHTVEWTPGILAHPTLDIAMNANWSGLVGEKLTNVLGRISESEAVSGIPGSETSQTGAPYCLTEEFVAVYRLHPLIPDVVDFFDIRNGKHKITRDVKSVAFKEARAPFYEDKLDMASVLYSFGINHPGAITYNNTPDFLRDLVAPDRDGVNERHIDLAAVDILRDRERGIPRYNQFRRLFHMPPARSFNALTGGNKLLARELAQVYDNDIEKVDLLIGCHCEPLPKGFGFSDTAFRVFILMASRRLKSDRFLATDWKPEIYTHEGMEWVQRTTMKDVLCRHHPELRSALKDVKNAFAPWDRIGQSKGFKVQTQPASVPASQPVTTTTTTSIKSKSVSSTRNVFKTGTSRSTTVSIQEMRSDEDIARIV